MKQPLNLWRPLFVSVLFVALTGFTAPNGGIGGTGRPRGGIGGTGVTAIGVIQKFGSIFVNGTEYRLLPSTRYRIDGQAADSYELHRGDAVFVEGDIHGAHSIAQSVRVQHAMIGVIEAIHHQGQDLKVLGQDIVLRPSTLWHLGTNRQGLAFKVGMEVAVSAFSSAPGVWQATRVRVVTKKPQTKGVPFLIRGSLHTIDAHTMVLGKHSFLFEGSKPSLSPGSYVVARGYYRSGHPVITTLRHATSLQDARGTQILVAGYIRGTASRWRYEGLTLRANTGPAPSPITRLAFFVAVRTATGHFIIQRITLPIHVMSFGLPLSAPHLSKGPRHAVIARPQLNRPQVDRPTLSRPEVIERPEMNQPDVPRPMSQP